MSLLALSAVTATGYAVAPKTLSDPVTGTSYTVPDDYFTDVDEMNAKADTTGLIYEWLVDSDTNAPGWAVTGTLPIFKGGCVEIPSSHAGKDKDGTERTGNVVAIGEKAFENNTKIVQLRIPGTMKEIRDNAFNGCTGLAHLYFTAPENPTDETMKIKLGYKIVTPDGEEHPLFVDTPLKYLDLARHIEPQQGMAYPSPFAAPEESILASNLKFVEISEPVTQISDCTLDNATAVEAVHLPATLKTIGGYAFQNTFSMEFLGLPDGLESVGAFAFAGTNSLRNVSIPPSVTFFGIDAFAYSGICPSPSTTMNISRKYRNGHSIAAACLEKSNTPEI